MAIEKSNYRICLSMKSHDGGNYLLEVTIAINILFLLVIG